MAGGGLRSPPYRAAVGLVVWAVEWWDWCDGAATLRGVDLEQLTFDRMLNVLLALQVEQLSNGWVQPIEVLNLLVAAPDLGAPPTIETWGMSADAQAAQDAFMAMGAR